MLTLLALAALAQVASRPAFAAPPVISDRAPVSPGWTVQGFQQWDFHSPVGARLLAVDRRELLAGFEHRPGKQAWIGEHIGKWLHAASMAGLALSSEEIASVRDALLACQEPDGYLGTYAKDQRFRLAAGADWDVWVHKYVLLGLLAQYERTGHAPTLAACRKVGNLLCDTFGPGKRSLNSAGTHMGMAATSVLEPMVLLYRWTGDSRYLGFCGSLVSSWDEPGGAGILRGLLAGKHVFEIGNGKAYEMLSNFVGICELYRQTGEARLLEAVVAGWRDIVEHQLYPTGSGSVREFWQRDPKFPTREEDQPCETCVTITWLQLNVQLFRLTNDRRYLDQIQLTFFNHLSGAQREIDGQWCYFTPLEGPKHPTRDITCCASSGPRGFVFANSIAVTAQGPRIQFNIPGLASGRTAGGAEVTLTATKYPYPGNCLITVDPKDPIELEIATYVPGGATLRPVDAATPLPAGLAIAKDGFATIRRKFTQRETISFGVDMPIEVLRGDRWGRPGCVGFRIGPVVIVGELPPEDPNIPLLPACEISIPAAAGAIAKAIERATAIVCGAEGSVETPTFALRATRPAGAPPKEVRAAIRPFKDAGLYGGSMELWFRDAAKPNPTSLFWLGQEGYSRAGNQTGHIQDNDPTTFRVTWNEKQSPEDFFSVTLAGPVPVARVVYRHGRTFHDGGWFDVARGGKPKIEGLRKAGGPWELLGELTNYPDTTAADPKNLRGGEAFELRLPSAVALAGIRVRGVGASGDNPQQNFTSCAELEAYGAP